MRPFRLFVALFLLLMLAPKLDLAQADYLGNCTHVRGSRVYRPDGVVVRYEYWGKRLVLASLHSGEVVQELETSFITSNLSNVDWSPDCRYVFGTANGDGMIWDAVRGGRVATFANVTPKNPPYWNPGRDALILEARGGSYLWNFRAGAPMLLTFSGHVCTTRYEYFDWEVAWDNTHGQVLVAPNYVSGNAVIAYEQATAQQIAVYDNACLQGPVKFVVTPDNQSLIVFTSESEAFAGYEKALTVWDRDSLQHVSVDANTQSAVLPSQVALSPDRHYLVLARIGTLRVWDLTRLAADVQSRDPVYRHPIDQTTERVRFVSNTVVETTDLNGRTARWDIETGARLD